MSHLLPKKKIIKKKKDPTIIHTGTPRQGELVDAFIYLEDIRKNFKAVYEAWKVKYAAEIKRYVRFGYSNYAVFTELVNDHFENLKTILEM